MRVDIEHLNTLLSGKNSFIEKLDYFGLKPP